MAPPLKRTTISTDHFPAAIEHVLRFEGGYVWDKDDPGGETNFGITKRSYPQLDIKALTKAHAAQIYRNDYWNANGCPALPWPLALYHFDACVNSGASRANKFLRATRDPASYLEERRAFYDRLIAKKPKLAKFRKGWMRRVDALAAVT